MNNDVKKSKTLRNVMLVCASLFGLLILYALSDYIIEKSIMQNAVQEELKDRGWADNVKTSDMQFDSKTGTFSQHTIFKDDVEGMSYEIFFVEEPTFAEKFMFQAYEPKTFISESSKDNEFQTDAKYNVIPEIEE